MATIADIEQGILNRLEDLGTFWDLSHEIRPLIVEALCEATLICGEPLQKQSAVAFTVAANQTIQTLPSNIFALVRVESAGSVVRKLSVWDLDMDNTGWETDLAQAMFTDWFPLGIGKFGVHPQVSAPVQVVLTGIPYPLTIPATSSSPIITPLPPYVGTETVDFQSEFFPAFMAYASHAARAKEGDPEFSGSMIDYEEFLAAMEELSRFAIRKSSLRFSRTLGAVSGITPVEKK